LSYAIFRYCLRHFDFHLHSLELPPPFALAPALLRLADAAT